MKLAEALILRADSQKRLAQLRDRLGRNALVQEGESPAEPPAGLLAEYEQVAAQWLDLVQRINRTNSTTPLDGVQTIADAIARRDNLKERWSAYSSLASQASVSQQRYGRSEIKMLPAVNVVDIQRVADGLAREHRDLDSRIQAANWATELVD